MCRFTLVWLAAAAAFGQQARPGPERIHRVEEQVVKVEDFAAEGYILDIGGGGEGIIGQLKPRQAVAIDRIRRELEEAPAGPLKVIMDATDLKFLDGSFETATAFFSLMYMDPETQANVMREAFRVLKPGGRFLIWDPVLPKRYDPVKDTVVIRLRIQLPDREVRTGYGTLFPPALHDMAYFAKLGEDAGFAVAARRESGQTFFMELKKP